MNDLDEHFERLKWARGEIDRLDAEVTKYTDSEPLEVYWHMDLARENPARIYRIRVREGVPKTVQIHAGTIINEMRSVLDALACTLAKRNGFKDVSGTYFPTGKTKAFFESKDVQRKVKKLADQDKATIAALQPYGGGNDMLYALHSSDIIRKHQRLILVAGEVERTRLGSAGGWTLDSNKLDFIHAGPGFPLDEPIARTALDFHIEIKQRAVVAFSEPNTIKSKPLVATLNDFASLVESILNLFL